MKPPIVVNESSNPSVPGDVTVFNSIAAAELHFEPWYIEEAHFVYDSEGAELEMWVDGGKLRIRPREPKVQEAELARMCFIAFLGDIGPKSDSLSLSALAEQSSKSATA
ncbi:MAG: hypothetical protein AAGJ29_00935 [Pseudomonadota bacterium]